MFTLEYSGSVKVQVGVVADVFVRARATTPSDLLVVAQRTVSSGTPSAGSARDALEVSAHELTPMVSEVFQLKLSAFVQNTLARAVDGLVSEVQRPLSALSDG